MRGNERFRDEEICTGTHMSRPRGSTCSLARSLAHQHSQLGRAAMGLRIR